MTTGSLSLVVCHANSPTDGAFPSKQILSTSDSNGLSGIQAPYEINFRDQKVAGSNPVTSTKNLSEDYNLQAFCCLVLLDFLSEIPYFLSKSGFRRTSPLSAAIGRQLIKGDVWNCVSGFGGAFRSGMFIGRSGRKRAVSA